MNDAMRRLEVLVGGWTMTHAWFLDSLDTETAARRPSSGSPMRSS